MNPNFVRFEKHDGERVYLNVSAIREIIVKEEVTVVHFNDSTTTYKKLISGLW
jgi:hypothetical protein